MMRALFLLLIPVVAACNTTITFESEVPGVTVHAMRLTTSHRAYVSPESLLPGQKSSEVMILVDDEDRSGRVTFELEKDGRRIALEVESGFKVHGGENNVFVLSPDTRVRHLLLQDTPMALWAESR